jgi:hypothetical protein
MHLIAYHHFELDKEPFIDFWSARYDANDDTFYKDNIGQELTEKRILEWFEWKNGRPLSKKKRTSVLKNFVARRRELDEIPEDEEPAAFLKRFSEGGRIWRIFWLHLCNQRFPIYDQHVHRAMRFIQYAVIKEIPGGEADAIRCYLEEYLPFNEQFKDLPQRDVDKALFAFGEFLGKCSKFAENYVAMGSPNFVRRRPLTSGGGPSRN